jgi:uncharacterized membrane protein YjjP (DUF1212 family)
MCVREAIDELYWVIAFVWMFVIYGSCMILYHKKNALSPFVIIGMIIALSIWGAFVDPSKWKFVLALIPSVVLIIIGLFTITEINRMIYNGRIVIDIECITLINKIIKI